MDIPNEVWAQGSPIPIALGEAIVYTYDFSGVGTPTAVVDELVYDEAGADQSALLSGSSSISGDVVTAKKFTPTAAGRYRYQVSLTINGNTICGLCDFYCFDPSSRI